MASINEALDRLERSAFRSSFHLSERDRAYVKWVGMDTVRRHCADFIRTRLAPAEPPNDGRQTPMRGHPCFVAQHACACCCRGCLEKWYRVKKGRALDEEQQKKIVDLLMAYIERELARPALSKKAKNREKAEDTGAKRNVSGATEKKQGVKP